MELPRRVHLIGIGGAGMAGLARYLLDLGHSVSGSDTARSAAAEDLMRAGAVVSYGHDAGHVDGSGLVVVSDAIATDNVEIEAARARSIRILRRAECVDLLAREKRSIMVAGSHGKSTTAAMIACILDEAELDPSFLTGADIRCLGDVRARVGNGPHIVVEVCEAFKNLESFNPDVAVLTNLDDEHVNHYASQGALDAAFADLAGRASVAILSGEDAGLDRIRPALGKATSFGLTPACDIAGEAGGAAFAVHVHGVRAGTVSLAVPGDHMRRNALAAIAACLAEGVPFETIARGLARFTGVARRWQEVGVSAGVRLVDDYAHHPAEVLASLETARHASPGSRLVAIFQPLLGSRLQRLHSAFAESLAVADLVLLLELDAGGEVGIAVGSEVVADGLRRRGVAVQVRAGVDDLVEYARHDLAAGDIVVVMGGRGMDGVAPRLHRRLAERDAADPTDARRRGWMAGVADRLRVPATVVDLFRRAVRADPAKPALHHPGGTLSYESLDAASDVVAAALAARGLAGCVVGVSLPHSVDLVVAMLGVMKAGATYLPLDVALPKDRAGYMLDRSGAAACIAREALNAACPHLPLDLLTTGRHAVPRGPGGGERAYICFTSGSTGYPKGIPIAHAALFALLGDIVPRFGLGPGSRMAFNTSIGFDVSLAELCGTLTAGAALVVGATRPMVGDRLADLIEERSVTHLSVTPSVLASMRPRALPALHTIIACGEACPPDLVRDWAPGRRFFNVYGPTETAIYATAARCDPAREVTIGTAMGHVQAHVLDDEQRPVPDREVGELCLSGIGLAEGYIGQPEETAQRFVRTALGRLYRTGDMVRRATNGDLLFLGRTDDQVKILGNRIELSEIERAALRQEGIADAAVCVGVGEPKALVCFVLPAPGFRFDEARFTAQLADWLPDSAIPAHVVPVTGIPLTASGKKDRLGLLKQHGPRILTWAEHYLGPYTTIEKRVAPLWRTVLKLDREVGMFDRFAALGGDSLAGLQLVAAVEAAFQVTVPPGYFGRLSTVPKMAVALDDLLWHGDGTRAATGSSFQDSRIYRQMFDLCGHWPGERRAPGNLISSLGPAAPDYDLFVCCQTEVEFQGLARWLPGSFRVHVMRSGHLVIDHGPGSLRQLASNYVAEIEAMEPPGILVIAGVCQGGVIAQIIAETLVRRGRHVPLLVLVEPMQPQPYAGHVALICGNDSFRNPLRPGGVGHAPFAAAFGTRYSIDFVESTHGEECNEPAVRDVARHVVRRLAAVMATPDVAV